MPNSNTSGAASGGTLGTNVVINTTIDNSGLASGVQDANKEINKIGTGGGLNAATNSATSFKAQIKLAREEALRLQLAGQQGTKPWRDQVQIIANLTDEMEGLGRATKAFDPGNKFQALSKVAGLAASSFGALTGTLTLLGVSADTANEAIAKLQSIQAIIGLIDAFGDAKDVLAPFIANLISSGAAAKTNAAATSALTAANTANAVAIGSTAAAQTTLGSTTNSTTASIVEQTAAMKVQSAAQVAQTEATLAQAEANKAAKIASIIEESANQVPEYDFAGYLERRAKSQAMASAAQEHANELQAAATRLMDLESIVASENTAAQAANATATEAKAAATVASTTAIEGATLATRIFSTALKGLGIGLVIAAVLYLVSSWDDLKKSVFSFLPSMERMTEIFNDVKSSVIGVGDVVVSFLIAPFKAVIDLINGDLQKAMSDLASGLDVVANYEEGVGKSRQLIRDKAAKEELEKSIKLNEEKIKHAKELGINTIALERQLYADKKKLAKDNQEELEKIESERVTFENAITKARMDKAREEAKRLSDLQKAVRVQADKDNADALKVLQKGYESERVKEELAISENYKSKIANTRKAYGASSTQLKTLMDAQATELGEVKLKYDQVLERAFKEQNDKALNSYDLRIKQLQDKYNEIKKNSPENADEINAFVTSETTKIRKEETVNRNVINDEVNLTNPALSARERQAAELQLLADKYLQEGLLKSQSDEEKILAEAKYNESVYNINSEYAQKDRELKQSQEDAEQRLNDTKYAIAESGLSTLGTLFGKNKALADALFAVEKGLAIGQIVVSAQRSIAQATANLAATPAVIGIVPNPAYALQAAATLKGIAATKLSAALGIANIVGQSVGKLMGGGSSPTTGGDSSANGGTNYNLAPQINPSRGDTNSAVQDVRITNNTPIKAYLTEKDIKTSRDKEAFYNNLSEV
jgi:hypothetical protein